MSAGLRVFFGFKKNRLLLLLTLLTLSFAFSSCSLAPSAHRATAPAGTDFASTLAHADRLAAENSWAQARDAYTAALAHAPDADARRWTEFRQLDASWRAEDYSGNPLSAGRRNHLVQRFTTAFDALLKTAPAAKDPEAFWLAVMRSRLAFRLKSFQFDQAADDRLALADRLGAQPPTAEATARYVEFLKSVLANGNLSPSFLHDNERRLLVHVDNALRLAAQPEDRADFAFRLAAFVDLKSNIPLDERARRWAAAVTLTRDTPLESLARARHFLFIARTGFAPDVPSDTPADLRAQLAELRALRSALPPSSPNETVKRIHEDLRRLEAWWDTPQLLVDAPARIQPGSPFRVNYGTAGHAKITVTLYRHTLENWSTRGADQRVLQRAGILANPKLTEETLAFLHRAGTEEIRRLTFDFDDAARRAWHRGEWEILPSAEPGFYTARVQSEGSTSTEVRTLDLIVSSVQAAATVSATLPGTLHVFRTSDHRPISSESLRGILREGESGSPWTATLDHVGNAPLAPLKPQPRGDVSSAHLSAWVGDQPLDLSFHSVQEQRPSLTAELIVDRPLYRPGEIVFWKLVARERQNGRFVLPTSTVRMSIGLQNHGTLLDNVPFQLNAFGSAHGRFVVPITARPGEAHLELTTDADPNQRAFLHSLFRVDHFVPPAVTADLELASVPNSLRPGSEITVRIRSQYFSGGAVVGAPVTCRFELQPLSRPFHAATEENPQLNAWKEALEKEPRSATTGLDGTAEFRLVLPAFLPTPLVLQIDARLEPSGAQAVHTTASWQIHPSGVQFALEEPRQPVAVQPRTAVSFVARVIDGRNQPFAVQGTAQLVEKRWSEAWLSPDGRVVSFEEMRRVVDAAPPEERATSEAQWKQLHAAYGTTVIATKAVTADANGKFQVEFTPPHAGLFHLQLETGGAAVAASGNFATDDYAVVAATNDSGPLAFPPKTIRLFSSLHPAAGQPLRFLALAPPGARGGWFTLSGENEYRSKRIEFNGPTTWITVDNPPAFAGTGTASFFVLDQPTANGRVVFPVQNGSTHLAVTLDPDTIETKPGAESFVKLTSHTSQGAPVASEFVLTASDDSVHVLAGRPDEAPTFWRYQSTVNVDTATTSLPRDSSVNSLDDPRPGTRLNPSGPVDEEALQLSPFEVSTRDNFGYAAASSLAGSRGRSLAEPSATLLGPNAKLDEDSITIRRRFSLTAAWQPEIFSHADGTAQVKIQYPDNLTRWRIEGYAVGADGNTFGQATAFTTTSLPFQARLQLPRTLIAGDTASPSALFVNRTARDASVLTALRVEGAAEFTAHEKPERENLTVPQQAEARTAWSITATRPGEAKFILGGRSNDHADGMELSVPVLEDGLQQESAASTRLAAGDNERSLRLTLPTPLDPARTQLTLQITPSYAATLLDALPYLIDYPYGCVEQTMNRFLPAVVAKKTLSDLGFDAASVERRILARASIERRILARASKSIPKPAAGLSELDEVVQQSLARLVQAQQPGGTFGWWPGQHHVDVWMTGYVAWGLALASEAGVEIPRNLAGETLRGLERLLTTATDFNDPLAWALAALARIQGKDPSPAARTLFSEMYAARDQLGASGRACLLLAAPTLGTPEQRGVLLRNLENGADRVKAADLGDTVSWGVTTDYWRAMDSSVESTSLVLLALLESDPRHPLIEPAMNWLTLNRRSARWRSTRDTAFAILALTRFIAVRNEASPEAEVEIFANRRSVQRVKLTRDSLLAGATSVPIDASLLRPGENVFTLRRLMGSSTVYAVALATSWARGDAVQPAGHLANIARDFVRQKSEPTLMGTLHLTSQPLAATGAVQAGEQVNARVTLTIPNELEYLMVEVPKPAGCEPLNPLSGWDARLVDPEMKMTEAPSALTREPDTLNEGRALYREEYDDRSVFFLDHVPAGTWEIRYGLRATTPGNFRALPAKATAMYVPEVRAQSDSRRLRIEKTPDLLPEPVRK